MRVTLPALTAMSILALSACTGPSKSSNPLQVTLGSGFTLPALLLHPEPADKAQQPAHLLGKPWYAAIEVTTGQHAQPTMLNNCTDYLVASPAVRPLREYETAAFTELAANCHAASLIAAAQPSRHSFIDNRLIDETLPQRIPSQLAMITSSSEQALISSGKTWVQVNTFTKFTAKLPDAGLYEHHQGEQELAEMARGDFDGDGLEEVLLSSFDRVSGGSYAGMRLFLVSRKVSGQPYQLRQVYPLSATALKVRRLPE